MRGNLLSMSLICDKFVTSAPLLIISFIYTSSPSSSNSNIFFYNLSLSLSVDKYPGDSILDGLLV